MRTQVAWLKSIRPKRSGALAGIVAGLLLTTGCQPNPELASVAVQPRTAPVRNIGNFNEALRCMDDMLWAQGKKDIYITSAGIPDATGTIAAGTKEMLITAVSKMSAKSGGFRFVDYDVTQLDVQILSELVGLPEDFAAPSYYIRGAITQLDSGVLSSAASAGISLPKLDLAVSQDQVVSVVSLDLNVGRLVTRQILPGMSASNSVAVVRSGKGADAGGVIGKAGLSFTISFDRSEGFHQAVRNLIELSTIELLGKLARVPYWQCLNIEQTNPTFKAEAREWFDMMSAAERTRFAQAGLTREGYYQSAVGTPANDAELRDAVARYQADNDLVPSGRVDFDVYYRLLGDNPRQRGPGPTVATETAAIERAAAERRPQAPRVVLNTTRGPRPSFRVNETMTLQVQPTQDAFLYCYYQDSDGSVARIFPNRFQPDAFVGARTLVEVPPGAEKPFNIRFAKDGSRESVACFASDLELGLKLRDELKAQDLAPLPVGGIDDIITEFRNIGGPRVNVAQLFIEVKR